MKKILFVTNHFRYANGVASVLKSLIENLDTDNYDIYLLTLYDFNIDFASQIIKKIKILKGFGFYFHGFDKIVGLIPLKLLYRLFIRQKFDVEIAFQFGMPTKIISVSNNPHKLCWMHGYDTKMVLRNYYSKFPFIINVSKEGRDRLIKDGFPKEKCKYCYNIIDENKIIQLAKENIEIKRNHKYVFITVGRFSKEKAIMRYVEVINKIKDLNIEYWIVGNGTEMLKIQKYIQDNQLQNIIKLLGHQNNPYKYIKNADLYVCTSYREGFSTASQEAAVLGIPILTTDVSGARELIELTECGMVVKNSSDGIQNGIINIEKTEIINEWKTIAKNNSHKLYKNNRVKAICDIINIFS